MKVRLRFSKTGALVYIGHLDVMRYFQKLFRRSGIPVAYSEGFSPHQILSFSHPLPLGMESYGEYADILLTDRISSKRALEAIKQNSVPEIEVMSFRALPDKCANAMASVGSARYQVLIDGPACSFDFEQAADDLMGRSEALIMKKTKKSEKEVNIRPFIYELKADNDKQMIEMLVSSGSRDNIKPEYVIDSMFKGIDPAPAIYDLTMKRIDQYTGDDHISLDAIGTDME